MIDPKLPTLSAECRSVRMLLRNVSVIGDGQKGNTSPAKDRYANSCVRVANVTCGIRLVRLLTYLKL